MFNAISALCFGLLLLLTLGPALLSAESSRMLGGGAPGGLSVLARAFSAPLAAAGVIFAVVGGTLSIDRRQRNLAAAVVGLIGALALLHKVHLI